MGVGGSLDFISKEVVRAPRFISAIGLEWLFRLVIQPKRFFRIMKAILVFPTLSLFEKFHVAE
jgi:N-acetylglucosaminyldiphosphoundecaprenol N-acetyl-beta-D-mannosaminyltransferase